VNVNTFGYWRGRLRDLAATTKAKQGPTSVATLVPVLVRRASASAPALALAVVELEWPNGLHLRTTLGVPELDALVRSLSPC
jgi:hypothetical protein